MLRFRYVTLKAESGKNPTLTGDYSPRHSSRRSERLSAHAPKGPRLKQASLLLQRTLPVLLQQQRPVQINPFRLLPKQKGRRDSQRSAQHATNHHVQPTLPRLFCKRRTALPWIDIPGADQPHSARDRQRAVWGKGV